MDWPVAETDNSLRRPDEPAAAERGVPRVRGGAGRPPRVPRSPLPSPCMRERRRRILDADRRRETRAGQRRRRIPVEGFIPPPNGRYVSRCWKREPREAPRRRGRTAPCVGRVRPRRVGRLRTPVGHVETRREDARPPSGRRGRVPTRGRSRRRRRDVRRRMRGDDTPARGPLSRHVGGRHGRETDRGSGSPTASPSESATALNSGWWWTTCLTRRASPGGAAPRARSRAAVSLGLTPSPPRRRPPSGRS